MICRSPPKANGFGGLDARADDQQSAARAPHRARSPSGRRPSVFDYGGRANRAERKFHGSECGIYLGSSAARADILANAKFDVGYGMLPYWPDVAGAPQNSIIGGATLWVLRGARAPNTRASRASSPSCRVPDVQAWWHQATGYLPITKPAYELSRAQGYYDRNPGTDISIKQITLHPADRQFPRLAARLLSAHPRYDRG